MSIALVDIQIRGEEVKHIPVTHGFSQKILGMVTPRGYAVPTRMQFGYKTAPSI